MATPPPPHGSLDGITVLELGSFIAGPFAGQLLGDHGADVIKIEAPRIGDPMRRWGVCGDDGQSLWWPAIARNKRSVAVDLRGEQGRAVVRDIASSCDVVLENFTPGRLEAWGLDHATLSATNPGLITAHVSGFGQTGPMAGLGGFGSIGEAMGGIRALTGYPDRPSVRAGVSLGDALAALFAVVGIQGALIERERSGVGQEVDVALYEAVMALTESMITDYEVAGHERVRSGPVLAGVAPSNVYPTADGTEIVIAANADQIFARLAAAMGEPGLSGDPRFASHAARGENMGELDRLIGEWTATYDADGLLSVLAEASVPAGRVFSAPDLLSDDHVAAREMVLRPDETGEKPMLGVVPKLTRTPGSVRSVGPRLGEHTAQVLADLCGYGPDRIAALTDSGVVAT